MTDRIFIKGLSLHAFHGVLAYESKVGQSFSIDLTLDIDLSVSSHSDKVADTVSYDKVAACATKAFCGKPYKLIEAAAGHVADAVLAAFPKVQTVEVTIHKPHAPIAAIFSDVGVMLTRKRAR
jgi:7,8-dihydroneopterin aldolase/epimerase/oxygenase